MQLQTETPEKNTAANQGEKNQAPAEPEPRQAEQFQAEQPHATWTTQFSGALSIIVFSLSGAWGWETLATGAPVILCLSQQLCRTKLKW